MKKYVSRTSRILILLAGSLLLAQGAWAQPASPKKLLGATYEKRSNGSTLKSASFAPDAGFTLRDAQSIFKQYLPLSPGDELRFKSQAAITPDVVVQRFVQYYKSIPVAHGAYTLTARSGVVQSMLGSFYKTGVLPITPAFGKEAALGKVLAHVGAQKYAWQDAAMEARIKQQKKNSQATWYPQPALTYVEDYTGEQPDGKLHLAYVADVYALQPLSHSLYYIDAVTGRLLFTDVLIHNTAATGASKYSGTVGFQTGHVGSAYYLVDSTRGSGIYTYNLSGGTNNSNHTEWTNTSTTWALNGGIDAHWAVSRAYDYWKNVRNRLSYDGLDGALYTFTNYGNGYDNAFWDGVSLNIGAGSGSANGGFDPLYCLDVIAHEMAHGVCQETAGLIYNRESGAMNEGFSDIWGSVIEAYADPHEVDAQAKSTWDIGEELSPTPLRSMKTPKLHGNPDTYGGAYWADASASCTPNNGNDQCGVHNNSGVLNHWFYLLTDGDAGTNDLGAAYQVIGIGMAKSAAIAYATEVTLAPNANYVAARAASIAAATALYGACSAEVASVTRAWYAVGVGVNYNPCTPQASFAGTTAQFTEDAASTACPASHTISVPVTFAGPALSGGNAVINIAASGSSMLSGVDYTLNTPSLTFTPGGATTQNVSITIIDNGAVDTARYIDLSMSLVAGGSNAVPSNVLTTQRITIVSDDRAPLPGGPELHYADTVNGYSNVSSCFSSSIAQSHYQYIIRPAELLAGGVLPNTPITALSFTVQVKNSAQPYNGFTIKMGNSATSAFSSATGFISSGLTTVYSGNLTTTIGSNTIQLSTPVQWDGTSNIIIETCFSNATAGTGNDRVDGHSDSYVCTAYNYSGATTAGGCALIYNNNLTNTAKPAFRFTQDVPPSPIATANTATRSWDVRAGQNVYFYNPGDGKLIAAMLGTTAGTGCTEAKIAQQGTGFVQAVFDTVARSNKEIAITATTNGSTASGDVAVYFLNTELAGIAPADLRLLRTTAATDAGITAANTMVLQPQLIAGTNYTGFRGTFNGLAGRYFLVAGRSAVGVSSITVGSDFIQVDANPYHDAIALSYNVSRDEAVNIYLCDITGKIVLSQPYTLREGRHRFTWGSGLDALPAGHYILRMAGAHTIFTKQLLKH